MPPSKYHQCSARWLEAPKTIPWRRTAPANSDMTSRFGPMLSAFHSLRELLYMEKPSWCSATGIT